MLKVGQILRQSLLLNIDIFDIELLLASTLNISRSILKAYPERRLNNIEEKKIKKNIQRRINGEPLEYLIGHKEFWNLDFIVTPDVLIPRYETELIVEIALKILKNATNNACILELGTGCGAIALSIASENPNINVIATEISPAALKIATLNAKSLHINNVNFMLGDWYQPFVLKDIKFDMILSNPPYIANFDPHLEKGDLRFEPNKALLGGNIDGMNSLHHIISKASKYLVSHGYLIVEHGYNQKNQVYQAFDNASFYNILSYKDIAGIPRAISGKIS